jgi:hypothetical protein
MPIIQRFQRKQTLSEHHLVICGLEQLASFIWKIPQINEETFFSFSLFLLFIAPKKNARNFNLYSIIFPS